MKAYLIGGCSDGQILVVDASITHFNSEDGDGISQSYERALGTTFEVGSRGERLNEEAFFIHTELLKHGTAFVMDYINARGQ